MQATHTPNSDDAPILVTGGTGTLGRHVVARLRDAGRIVRILSRGRREATVPGDGIEYVTADLANGPLSDQAITGCEIIIHLAGSAKGDEHKTRSLLRAVSAAGVSHLVYISVVGADRVPVESPVDRAMFGYFASKLESERLIAESGVPWSTLRSTQFHDAILTTAQGLARMPLIPVPAGFRFQPIDPAEVAAQLVEVALGEPAGLVPDVGGPRVYELAELVRSYVRASGKHRLIVPLPFPGKAAAANRHGATLTPNRAVGKRTWEEYLAARVESRGDGGRELRPAQEDGP
jgi:uncharacterized protein YbjT (DUF2867 family)